MVRCALSDSALSAYGIVPCEHAPAHFTGHLQCLNSLSHRHFACTQPEAAAPLFTPSNGDMPHLTTLLKRFQPKYFRINHSNQYKTFIIHHIATDPHHPLYLQRNREYESRKRKGLWWHVTSGADLSKSGVVRSTCRKRLRKAFASVLKERGFDEFGMLVEPELLEKYIGVGLLPVKGGDNVAFKGSMKFHALGSLIPAKQEDVKKEFTVIVDAMLGDLKEQLREEKRADAVRSQLDWRSKLRTAPLSAR